MSQVITGLAGMPVFVTRSRLDNASLAAAVESRGGVPIFAPLIDVVFIHTAEAIAAVSRLTSYDAVVFTSSNAVRALHKWMESSGSDIASSQLPSAYVVGSQTAQQAKMMGFAVQVLPGVKDGATLVVAMVQMGILSPHAHVLFPHGQRTDTTIEDVLRAVGHQVQSVVAYDTVLVDLDVASWQQALNGQQRPTVLLFSPSMVEVLSLHVASAWWRQSRWQPRIACIGETTANVCRQVGLAVDIVAEVGTTTSLLDALCATVNLQVRID